MSLLYANEHLNCKNYKKEGSLIKLVSYTKGESLISIPSVFSKLCFLVKGSLYLSVNETHEKKITENEFFLIPSNAAFSGEVLEDSYCIVIHFQVQINLCENFSMTELYEYYNKEVKPPFTTLPFNKQLSTYIDLLDQYLCDGIYCVHFHEMKKQELFFLLRAYYPKEDLASLFYPLLSKEDLHFKNFVMEKCLCAKSVQELAQMANYSTSGFIKKFSRSFNESPYRWMVQYKADHILHDINSEENSLKEIYTKYNFSSMSHFISFCKKQYGDTPGKIRTRKNEF